jgi:hypothetical protein
MFLTFSLESTIVFKVGDDVERIGSLVPPYMKCGTVIRLIPNRDGIEWFTEYEVNFGNQLIATFYTPQLRLAETVLPEAAD